MTTAAASAAQPTATHTVLCVDDSEWMRNEDYFATRWSAQRQALSILLYSSSSPRDLWTLISMSGHKPRVVMGPSHASAEVQGAVDRLDLYGDHCEVFRALQLAFLCLSRRNDARGRLVVFLGSPPEQRTMSPAADQETARLVAALSSLQGFNADVVAFGEAAVGGGPIFLSSLVASLNARGVSSGRSAASRHPHPPSHLIVVPPCSAGGPVDSLPFHMLRVLVRDRETARSVWLKAFGPGCGSGEEGGDDAASCASPVSANALRRSCPVNLRTGTGVSTDGCRHQAIAVSPLALPTTPTRRQLQQQSSNPLNFTVTLAVSRQGATSQSEEDSTSPRKGTKLVLSVPVRPVYRETIVELPCGVCDVSSSRVVTSRPGWGCLSFVRISELNFLLVWRRAASLMVDNARPEIQIVVSTRSSRARMMDRGDERGRFFALERTRFPLQRRVSMFWIRAEDTDRCKEAVRVINEQLEPREPPPSQASDVGNHGQVETDPGISSLVSLIPLLLQESPVRQRRQSVSEEVSSLAHEVAVDPPVETSSLVATEMFPPRSSPVAIPVSPPEAPTIRPMRSPMMSLDKDPPSSPRLKPLPSPASSPLITSTVPGPVTIAGTGSGAPSVSGSPAVQVRYDSSAIHKPRRPSVSFVPRVRATPMVPRTSSTPTPPSSPISANLVTPVASPPPTESPLASSPPTDPSAKARGGF